MLNILFFDYEGHFFIIIIFFFFFMSENSC